MNLIELLKHQQEFVDATEHEVMMLAPMATGKTFIQLYDAKEYALKYPGSTQVYMCDGFVGRHINIQSKFMKESIYDSIRDRVIFSNDSKIYFVTRNDGKFKEMLCTGFVLDVFRFDGEVFNLSFYLYGRILYCLRPPENRPWHIKITARDTLYSIVKGGRFRIIESTEKNPFMNFRPTMLECEWIGNKNN